MKTLQIIIFILTCTALCSCNNTTTDKTEILHINETADFVDTIEVFTDSINFGQKLNNKIEVYKISTDENTFAKVCLYERSNSRWKLKDTLTLDAVIVNDLDTEIKDFNNDNFKDIIFTTGMAARGGNIVQTLILYSPRTKSLKLIKNSESFPNLMYNEKLDCIDALILTGGQTTYFLKIEEDSLKPFANVDQRDERIISEILDANGNWKEIIRITENPDSFDRFINFNPIEKRK